MNKEHTGLSGLCTVFAEVSPRGTNQKTLKLPNYWKRKNIAKNYAPNSFVGGGTFFSRAFHILILLSWFIGRDYINRGLGVGGHRGHQAMTNELKRTQISYATLVWGN
jgi:hypothetical protein